VTLGASTLLYGEMERGNIDDYVVRAVDGKVLLIVKFIILHQTERV